MELVVVWIETLTGAIYRMPDVPPGHLSRLREQLRMRTETVVVPNVSEAALSIPLRIIKEVGIVGQQTIWSKPDQG